MVELVDTRDLKSLDPNGLCWFKSDWGYKNIILGIDKGLIVSDQIIITDVIAHI